MANFDKELVSSLLETKDIARTLVYTDVTGSTMDDARRLAHQGKCVGFITRMIEA